jgi:D-serine deaminase-like pyridoxal phosphate-dependent protein
MQPIVTPSLGLDLSKLDANIEQMQAACSRAGTRLRPHAKGHKTSWIAERQLAAGAAGIAVATAREAMHMAGAGIPDVLITSTLSPGNARIAATAARSTALSVVAGCVDAVRVLDDAAVSADTTLGVLVDIDVGQRRGGAATPEEAVAIAAAIRDARRLTVAGVQGYEGHVQGIADPADRAAAHAAAAGILRGAVEALAGDSFPVTWVTSAGTGTAAPALRLPDLITEIQPGSYALMDATYGRYPDIAFENALRVRTSVVARVSPSEVIVDAGHRSVSTDMGPAAVAGLDAAWESAGDEHGRVIGDVAHLAFGDHVELIPSHSDTTVPLHGEYELSGGPPDRVAVLR